MVKDVKVVLWFGRLTFLLMTVQYPTLIVVGKGLIRVIAMSRLSILEGTILRISQDHIPKRTKQTFELSLLFKAYD